MNNEESRMQCAAIERIDHLFRLHYPQYMIELEDSKKRKRKVAPIYATPNGSNRKIVTAAILKREGVRSGIPDLTLPIPSKFCHGLYIEVKTEKGRMSNNQSSWKAFLDKVGYNTMICRSADEILFVVEQHMRHL